MTIEQLRDRLRTICEKAGGQKVWAAENGLSTTFVSDVIGGRREPGARVLAAMGLERVVSYRKVPTAARGKLGKGKRDE